MNEFDPRDLIDRHAEQELFRNLVTFKSAARMLTIRDKGGRGKSSLLKRLRYNCQYEMMPPIPVCLIELDRMDDPSPFPFVVQVVEGLNIWDRFAKFRQHNEARTLRDFAVFSSGSDMKYRESRILANIHGGANVEGPVAEEATIIGTYVDKLNIQNPEFTEEQEQLARQKCAEAFFEDLRTICAAEPMVLILDAWERCNLELRQWIRDEFLAKHCCHFDRNLRPDKLAIIVASRPYEPANTRQGLRPNEFRPLFKDEHDHETTVLSIKSLSEWDKEHVSAFMQNNGCPEPSEEEISFIQSRLKVGWSLEKILTLIDEYLKSPT